MPINTNPLFNVCVTGISVSGTHEAGKKCCDDCAKGVDPPGYETLTAETKASVSTAVVLGAGVTLAFNQRGFGDLHLGGKLEVGLVGRPIGDASRETSECNDNGGTHRNLIANKIIEDIQLKNADKMYTPKKSGGNEDCQKD